MIPDDDPRRTDCAGSLEVEEAPGSPLPVPVDWRPQPPIATANTIAKRTLVRSMRCNLRSVGAYETSVTAALRRRPSPDNLGQHLIGGTDRDIHIARHAARSVLVQNALPLLDRRGPRWRRVRFVPCLQHRKRRDQRRQRQRLNLCGSRQDSGKRSYAGELEARELCRCASKRRTRSEEHTSELQ